MKNEKWLLCQQRCDAMEQQLLSWEQREEQLNQKWRAAGEEVEQARNVLEKIQQEKGELIKERYLIVDSSALMLLLIGSPNHRIPFCYNLCASTL